MQVRGSIARLTAVALSQPLSSETGFIIEISLIEAVSNQLTPSRKSKRDLVNWNQTKAGRDYITVIWIRSLTSPPSAIQCFWMESSHLIPADSFLGGWDASTDGLNRDEASSSVCGAKLLVDCASAPPHHVGAWPLWRLSPGRENRGPLVWQRHVDRKHNAFTW